MKRLTQINGVAEYEAVQCMNCGPENAGEHLENCGYCSCHINVVDRLGAYEDTGLTPDEIKAIIQSTNNRRPEMEKKILDVTCGSRTIWFNKQHPAAIYCDKRREIMSGLWKSGDGNSERHCLVEPDVVCDFTDLPFPDEAFSLVVFDPPHLIRAKKTSWLVKKYGKLDDTWPQMLHDGFAECMRVLKPDGVLIFKWSEHDIPAKKVWDAIGATPLFGHHSGKKSMTFWGCFMKLREEYHE